MEHTEATLKSYIIGFVLSVLLTLFSFYLVSEQISTSWNLNILVSGLALVQMIVQLLFFFHLGEKTPHTQWNLLLFLFMLSTLLIVVLGSLWVMYNLDYYMM